MNQADQGVSTVNVWWLKLFNIFSIIGIIYLIYLKTNNTGNYSFVKTIQPNLLHFQDSKPLKEIDDSNLDFVDSRIDVSFESEDKYNISVIDEILQSRSTQLINFITRNQKKTTDCSLISKYVIIATPHGHNGYGNSGNHFIEFIHGLWIAEQLNSVLVIPSWMEESTLKFFAWTYLISSFCVLRESTHSLKLSFMSKVHAIESVDLFYVHDLISDPRLNLSFSSREHIASYLSRHYLLVHAIIWSSPSHSLIRWAKKVIDKDLQSGYDYFAVHKRNFDGGCQRIYRSNNASVDHFFGWENTGFNELPIINATKNYWILHNRSTSPINDDDNQREIHASDHSDRQKLWMEWNAFQYENPLCHMNWEFITDTIDLHDEYRVNDQDRKVFIAFDMQGSIASYLSRGAVFSFISLKNTTLLIERSDQYLAQDSLSNHADDSTNGSHHHTKPQQLLSNSRNTTNIHKFIDLFICIHSKFFLQNPLSTFSQQIAIVRLLLGLQSVPMQYGLDFRMKNDTLSEWVSYKSLLAAFHEMNSR